MPRTKEVWKRVPGFPTYEVSNRGQVRSWHNSNNPEPQILRLSLIKGRVQLLLTHNGVQKGFGVARLILTVFVRPPRPGEIARHYHDPDPWNLNLWNLRWGTTQENKNDCARHNGGVHPSQSEESNRKRSESLLKLGLKRSAETREKMAAAKRGIPRSAETKAKISATKQRQRLIRLGITE